MYKEHKIEGKQMDMELGLTYTSTMEVTEDRTARSMGSGDLRVLATPAMLALMENASMMAVAQALPEGSTTVGGHISSSHLMPTPVGAEVSATATLTAAEGRKLTFRVEAHDEAGHLLGEGVHLRFVALGDITNGDNGSDAIDNDREELRYVCKKNCPCAHCFPDGDDRWLFGTEL